MGKQASRNRPPLAVIASALANYKVCQVATDLAVSRGQTSAAYSGTDNFLDTLLKNTYKDVGSMQISLATLQDILVHGRHVDEALAFRNACALRQ